MNQKTIQRDQKNCHVLILHDHKKLGLKTERYSINLFLNIKTARKNHVFEQSYKIT